MSDFNIVSRIIIDIGYAGVNFKIALREIYPELETMGDTVLSDALYDIVSNIINNILPNKNDSVLALNYNEPYVPLCLKNSPVPVAIDIHKARQLDVIYKNLAVYVIEEYFKYVDKPNTYPLLEACAVNYIVLAVIKIGQE